MTFPHRLEKSVMDRQCVAFEAERTKLLMRWHARWVDLCGSSIQLRRTRCKSLEHWQRHITYIERGEFWPKIISAASDRQDKSFCLEMLPPALSLSSQHKLLQREFSKLASTRLSYFAARMQISKRRKRVRHSFTANGNGMGVLLSMAVLFVRPHRWCEHSPHDCCCRTRHVHVPCR